MPRVKVARKSTAIDMTAMCDVAFLLLTFFILTAKPRVDDPSKAEVPASSNETLVPESNLATISVGNGNKIYFSLTESDVRVGALKAMSEKYKQPFTPAEEAKFANTEVFGVPMNQLKQFLDMDEAQQKSYVQPGIQVDTTASNELGDWLYTARQADKALHDKALDIAIKGDKKELYPVINEVISTLGKQKLFKFRLITNLRTAAKK